MNVAEASTTLVWGAATAYAIALVCFTMLLARAADHVAVRESAAVGARGSGPTTADGRVSTTHADSSSSSITTAATTSTATTTDGPGSGRAARSKAEGIARATALA